MHLFPCERARSPDPTIYFYTEACQLQYTDTRAHHSIIY